MRTYWPNNKTTAVSLTYDDGLPEHLDSVPRALEKRGFRGTFYIHGKSYALNNDIEGLRSIAQCGHELGNHSLFHPCRDDEKKKAWLDESYNLSHYNPRRIIDELTLQNLVLSLVDGKKKRSYAATCGDLHIRDNEDMVPLVGDFFTAIRGVNDGQSWVPGGPMPKVVHGTSGDSKTASYLLEKLDEARAKGAWIVYLFHGVGDTSRRLAIDEEEHEKFLDGLANRQDVYVAPVTDIAEYYHNTHTHALKS